ncbi:MAG: hypothetical protein XE11_0843 [Methanomicrobiales archaeon 53_19]|jgi:hypothetical protein|nr:MAG: hypothetical protein XD88_0048 [Methanocalculus sp. 52_23]KUL04118.1 MAG: hypothetical protein XE11_0843 [Methanomicrobiales archaeon 53_19]
MRWFLVLSRVMMIDPEYLDLRAEGGFRIAFAEYICPASRMLHEKAGFHSPGAISA